MSFLSESCTTELIKNRSQLQESQFDKLSFSWTLFDRYWRVSLSRHSSVTSEIVFFGSGNVKNDETFGKLQNKIVINVSRFEITFVRGFRSFNIVKMSLFTTTFCRSSGVMIMKRTSKWDVTVNWVVESENIHETAASECVRLPDRYCKACIKI